MTWTIETHNAAVNAEISALPADMRARLVRVFRLMEAHGFQNLPTGMVKQLEGKLWEVRISAPSGISRAIYITAIGKRIIILRVFVKKTQKTPRRELELARQRAKEII